MSVRRVEGQRLDIVLQKLRESDKPAAILELQEVQESPKLAKDASGRLEQESSLETVLIDFIMPIVSDAGIFQDDRAIMLLSYLRDELLPNMDDSEELHSLATLIIDDEIARHHFVNERRQASIAV